MTTNYSSINEPNDKEDVEDKSDITEPLISLSSNSIQDGAEAETAADTVAETRRASISSRPSSSLLLPEESRTTEENPQQQQHSSISCTITSLLFSCRRHYHGDRAALILPYMFLTLLFIPPIFFLLCRIPATPTFISTDYPHITQKYHNKDLLSYSVLSPPTSELPAYEQELIDGGGPLNHFTLVGTHNSYHLANILGSIAVPSWRYSHKNLLDQLDMGIRHLELDVWYNVESKHWEVWHQTVDSLSNAPPLLKDCLRIINTWSESHSSHFPLVINLDLKGSYYVEKWMLLPWGYAEGSHHVMVDALCDLEKLITYVWDEKKVLKASDLVKNSSQPKEDDNNTNKDDGNSTKDDGNSTKDDDNTTTEDDNSPKEEATKYSKSLREAVQRHGWPDVRTLVGKSLFQLNVYSANAVYRFDAPQDLLFVRGKVDYEESEEGFEGEAKLLSEDDDSDITDREEEEEKYKEEEIGGKAADGFVYFEADLNRNASIAYQHHFPNAVFRAAILRQDDYHRDKRNLRRSEGKKHLDKKLTEEAKEELQRLVTNGIHLIATDHPGRIGGPFIMRNGLWRGDANEEKEIIKNY